MSYDLLIIGAGVSGLYTWKIAETYNLNGFIIESSENYGGQLTNTYPEKKIRNMPGFDSISAKEFAKILFDSINKENSLIKLLLNTKIINIKENKDNNSKTFKVTFSNNTEEEFKFIVIADGYGQFEPKTITTKSYDNLLYAINKTDLFENKKIAIFGGGDSAIDWANNLVKKSDKTYLIHRRNEFRGTTKNTIDFEENGGLVKIPFVLNSFIEENDLISKIIIKNSENDDIKEIIDIDYVIVQFGNQIKKSEYPNLDIKRDLLKKIIVDNNMETTIKQVYAIGDSCSYDRKMRNIIFSFAESLKAITTIESIISGKNIHRNW